ALETQQIHLAALQQARIIGPVRGVAGNAAISLDWSVLLCKGPGFIGMTVEADLVLSRCRSQLRVQESPVLVVTIGAQNQAFIDAVMERLGEIRLGLQMAAVAQSRLSRLEQLPVDFRGVNRMAIHAADVVLEVRRTQEVRMLFTELMASQAALG